MSSIARCLSTALLVVGVSACAPPTSDDEAPTTEAPVSLDSTAASLDPIAESYVQLALALGQHDQDYVDAYHGPADWKEAAVNAQKGLEEIRDEAEALLTKIPDTPDNADDVARLRYSYLRSQIQSLAARARLVNGEKMTFDEESQALYNAVSPQLSEDHFLATLAEMEGLLAEEGFTEGTINERYDQFRAQFVIPPDRVDEVFRTAVDACRERTLVHIELPAEESFEIEYVTDKSWSAYNWYQGGFHSLIQVNTDLPIAIDRAIDLACHEGYPGHHVYNLLLEKNLVKDRGWIEFQVYPLFSPQSLIAEGSANFGIEMAFPGAERLAYERDVLFPLAGLDPEKAATYEALRQLSDRLGYASNEVGRRYLDGETDAAGAVDWFVKYAAMSRPRGEQRLRFIEQYRTYVINYNLGQDLVRDWMDAQASPDDTAARWQAFTKLLSTPRLPGDIVLDESSAGS